MAQPGDASVYGRPAHPAPLPSPQGVVNRRPVSSTANRSISTPIINHGHSSHPPSLIIGHPSDQLGPTFTGFYGPGGQSHEQSLPPSAVPPPISIYERLIPPGQTPAHSRSSSYSGPTPSWKPPSTAPPHDPPPPPSPPDPPTYPYLSIYTRLLPPKRQSASVPHRPSRASLRPNDSQPTSYTVSPPASPPVPTPTLSPNPSSTPASSFPSASPPKGTSSVFTPITPPAPSPSPAISIDALEASPGLVDCPFCRARCLTRVEKHNGKATKKIAAYMSMLAIVGAVLPYAFHWCQDLAHFCTRCGEKVATRKYDLDSLTLQSAERRAPPPLPPRPISGIAEMAGSDVGELAGDLKTLEVDGFVRYEVEGAPAVAEMDAGPDGIGVYEMEHINRGVGTQKRIKRALEVVPPMPPLPTSVPLNARAGDEGMKPPAELPLPRDMKSIPQDTIPSPPVEHWPRKPSTASFPKEGASSPPAPDRPPPPLPTPPAA